MQGFLQERIIKARTVWSEWVHEAPKSKKSQRASTGYVLGSTQQQIWRSHVLWPNPKGQKPGRFWNWAQGEKSQAKREVRAKTRFMSRVGRATVFFYWSLAKWYLGKSGCVDVGLLRKVKWQSLLLRVDGERRLGLRKWRTFTFLCCSYNNKFCMSPTSSQRFAKIWWVRQRVDNRRL